MFLWASQVVLVVKNPPANAGDIKDAGSISVSGRSPGEGHGNPLQYSCWQNPTHRGAWQATVHGVANSWTGLKQLSMHTCIFLLYIKWLGKDKSFTLITVILEDYNIHYLIHPQGNPLPILEEENWGWQKLVVNPRSCFKVWGLSSPLKWLST